MNSAEEMALLAEERWLIENLQTIRQQRNALRVEALYYQGLKASLLANHAAEFGMNPDVPKSPEYPTADDREWDPIPEPTYPDQHLADLVASGQSSKHADILRRVQQLGSKAVPSNIDDFNILEGSCNNQELQNLSIATEKPESWEVEEEYESEEEEWSNIILEMGMLVGNQEELEEPL